MGVEAEDMGGGEEIAEEGGIEEGGMDDGGSEEGGREVGGSWDELMTLVMMLVTTLVVSITILVVSTGGGEDTGVVTGGGGTLEVTVGGTCADDPDIQKVVVQQKERAQGKLGPIVIWFYNMKRMGKGHAPPACARFKDKRQRGSKGGAPDVISPVNGTEPNSHLDELMAATGTIPRIGTVGREV